MNANRMASASTILRRVAANRLRRITSAFTLNQVGTVGRQALANLRKMLGINRKIASVRRDAVPKVLDQLEPVLDR